MINADDLKCTLRDIAAILTAQQVAFHVTGGLATSFYGEPRFTQDIDLVVTTPASPALARLITALKQKFIIDEIAVIDAVKCKRLFQALHEETMIKVDFHVGEAIEGELKRSRKEEILLGITVPLVSKEDAILSKLIWISKGSHKSHQDVKMMLKRSGGIDLNYLNAEAVKLRVDAILNEITAELDKENNI